MPGISAGAISAVHAFLPDDTLKLISVSRLFACGPDGFEIALHQRAPQGAGAAQEIAMVSCREALADEILSSFALCTASLPLREIIPLPAVVTSESASAAEAAAISVDEVTVFSSPAAEQ